MATVDVAKLKAFVAVSLYMGIKKVPNIRVFWKKSEPLLYCHVILQLFSGNRRLLLNKCRHITNPSSISSDRSSPNYDKMKKVRWLLMEIKDRCAKHWNIGENITIDEMMVHYKGSYCPARQYMPKKPKKWRLQM